MGVKTLVSEGEYLRTGYASPEPDFIEGEIIERAMPNTFHSQAVLALISIFIRQASVLFPLPELRIQVAPNRYRVVDLAVFNRRPLHAVPEFAPLVAIEVLSPDDSHTELIRKFDDYSALGIPHIWLVDPVSKRFSVYHDESLQAVRLLEAPGVIIRPADVFGTV